MRRALFTLLAGGLTSLFAGCCHTRGVCDCETDNHCATRAPWVQNAEAPIATTGGAASDTPRSLPPGKLE